MGLASGLRTYKLRYGHRGENQPVLDLQTQKVSITSQNHGFAVDLESISDNMKISHISLNDNTIEGIESNKFPAFSVQYHPESSPGPHDSRYLFEKFKQLMLKHAKKK